MIKREFWKKLQGSNARVSDKEIEKKESGLNIRLPKSYLEIMKEQNGGFVEYIFNSKQNINKDELWPIEEFLKIDELASLEKYEDAGWEFDFLLSSDLKKLIAFSQKGVIFWCFDYRNIKLKEPKICFIDTNNKIDLILADSFDKYLG